MVRTATITTALALAAFAAVALDNNAVHAKGTYVAKLPNGDKVEGVKALGHEDVAGGGPLNDFGKAFKEAKYEWTKELCEADSDKDGQTNGQELGDPCCEWKEGATPRWTTGVSAPGDASKKSDPSLWSSVKCDGSASGKNATTPAEKEGAKDGAKDTKAPAKSGAAGVAMSVTGVVLGAASSLLWL